VTNKSPTVASYGGARLTLAGAAVSWRPGVVHTPRTVNTVSLIPSNSRVEATSNAAATTQPPRSLLPRRHCRRRRCVGARFPRNQPAHAVLCSLRRVCEGKLGRTKTPVLLTPTPTLVRGQSHTCITIFLLFVCLSVCLSVRRASIKVPVEGSFCW